jgi:hypothetical protein
MPEPDRPASFGVAPAEGTRANATASTDAISRAIPRAAAPVPGPGLVIEDDLT